jgi:hypothetical protein
MKLLVIIMHEIYAENQPFPTLVSEISKPKKNKKKARKKNKKK